LFAATMEAKAVLSSGFQLEEDGQHDKTFHTRVIVLDRACALTIDHQSSINAASIEMVDKLELSTTPLPHPYMLSWNSDQLLIMHQTKVQFLLGNLSFQVLCDVIPIPMVSCHLLLGEPWTKEHHVSYKCITNTYAIQQVQVYVLRSMKSEQFFAWRKEHHAKIMEFYKHKEKVKKEVAEAAMVVTVPVHSPNEKVITAAIYVATVPSVEQVLANDTIATEDDSKPRSVSPKEGKDDTAAPLYTTTHYAPEPKDEGVFSSYVHPDLNSDQNKNKEVQNMHGIYGQRCMLNYARRPGALHAWMRQTSADVYDHMQIELASKGRASYVHTFYQREATNDSGWFEKEEKINFLFIFLPRKENIGEVIRMVGSWDFLCLCATGWGPPG
jgi:hypothetical protein